MLPPLGDCLVRLNARAGPAHRQPAWSVRGPLCTCCALCAIKHMTPKHWCVRAARERQEGVKKHRYAVLKGCCNGILLDRPLPFKSHQSYRPLLCFIPALQEICSGLAKKSAVMTVMTSTPRLASHYRGNAVIVTALISACIFWLLSAFWYSSALFSAHLYGFLMLYSLLDFVLMLFSVFLRYAVIWLWSDRGVSSLTVNDNSESLYSSESLSLWGYL